jgi:hypothetical protein
MAGPRNAHDQVRAIVVNLANGKDIEQLGMQRAAIKLKNQLANPRADEKNGHEVPASRLGTLPMPRRL